MNELVIKRLEHARNFSTRKTTEIQNQNTPANGRGKVYYLTNILLKRLQLLCKLLHQGDHPAQKYRSSSP